MISKIKLLLLAVLTFLITDVNAAYTGLTSEVYAENAIPGYTTYRIYANFDDVGDQLVSITGSQAAELFFNTTGDFYQNGFGNAYATGTSPALITVFPELEFDSWFTIGGEDNTQTTLNSIGVDVTNFEGGGNQVINDITGGGWFVLPNTEPLAFATSGKVLIAQLTTNGDLDMQFNVQWRDSAGNDQQNDGEALSVEYLSPPSYDGLSFELVASDAIAGFNTYRIYANFTNPNDQVVTVFGQDTSPLTLSTTGTFYQNSFGGPTSNDINTAIFAADPDLEYDSWVTIGTESQPSNLNVIGVDFTAFEATGGPIVVNDVFGGGWFLVPDTEPLAFPDAQGRVLLGQVTTNGITTFTANIQYRAQDGNSYEEMDSIVFPDAIAGCTDSAACNFDASATLDDSSCVFADGPCEECSGATDGSGTVLNNDSDNDGVCDDDEISGCQDSSACNYNEAATDGGVTCLFADEACEECSGETDGTGTVVDNDSDDDGICDDDEIAGCQDLAACNYNSAATDSGVTCEFADDACEECSGETDGSGTVIDNDSDDDGVCDLDEVVGCEDSAACNYNSAATDSGVICEYADGACEECSGETNGTGTVIDNDSDNDGVCDADEIVGCQDSAACNYNSAATDSGVPCLYADEACEECSGETDGTGTVVDNDSDNDGVCDADEIVGCQDAAACNYNAAATDSGVACEYANEACEECSGEMDGTGTVVDNDTDNDGVCDSDEIAGCQDSSACNFNPAATDDDGSCAVNDECGVCGGSGTTGCTDPGADNYDSTAACDDGSCIVAGCTYDFALNYNPAATYDDGSCLERIDGCTDSEALNFDSSANNEDGSCEYDVFGCTDCTADNYNSLATIEDGSCEYTDTCVGDLNSDGFVTASDLTIFLSVFGTECINVD